MGEITKIYLYASLPIARSFIMKQFLGQLSKDTLIYGIGGVLAKGVAFLLMPLYTRIFPPADFGTIEMLVTINGFLTAFFNLGMDSALSFYFFEQKKKGKHAQAEVVTTILKLQIALGIIIVVTATLVSPLLNTWFFKGKLSLHHFAVAFSATLLTTLMSQSAQVYRLLYRPFAFITITTLQSLIAAGVTIALVLHFNYGIAGYFWGILSGSGIMAITGWFSLKDYVLTNSKLEGWIPRLLKFGAPFIPASLAMYVMMASDRWFLSNLRPEEELGFYSVAAKFAMLITVAVETFRQAWWPIAMDKIQQDSGPAFFRLIARLYLGTGVAGIVLLTYLSPYLVRTFTAEAYHHAYPAVGILSWHAVFYGFYMISSAGLWKTEKTFWMPAVMALAAGVNIVLCYFLIPTYGVIGAALSTSLSFLIWNIIALLLSEKYWRINLPIKLHSIQILLGVVGTYLIMTCWDKELSVLAQTIICLCTLAAISFVTLSSIFFKRS